MAGGAGPQEAPERLGKYEVLRRLGQGAMGVVYEAHDPFLDRAVALKVMLPQVAADPEQKLRFEREARAVARLMHPNVITVFDLGYHTDGSPYIAMELLRGRDLQQVLRDGPLSLERSLAIVMQALEGLGHAHAAGIVHRDVKPANVFLGDDGSLKIMDFGVARFTVSSLTSMGVVVGTPEYMSPEQVAAEPVDARSDLFGVCALLCELVTGQRPFHADSLLSTLYKIAHAEPRIELPAGDEFLALLPVLRKGLAKPVAERYQSAAEFAAELRACLTPGAKARVPGRGSISPLAAATPATVDLRVGPVPHLAPASPPARPLPQLPAPNPAGLFAVLRDIEAGRKSGHLHFDDGRARRSLLCSSGEVLHGTSDAPGEHLGDILVRYGRLEQRELDRAVAVALAERRQVGRVLLEMGLLDEPRLQEAVGLHAREILFEASSRPGKFSFEESGPDTRPDRSSPSNLSIVELILEAARRVQDPGEVRAMLGSLDRLLAVSRDAAARFRHIQLTPADGFLLSRIDGRLTAREVLQLIPLPAESVEHSLFSLLATGVVEYRAARPKPVHPTGASQAGQDLARERKRREELRRAAEREVEEKRKNEALRALIRETHEGLAGKDHFQLLGVSRRSSEGQVKEAYLRLARTFHPDSTLDPSLSDLRPLREAVFARLIEALETLSKPDLRRLYVARLDERGGTKPAPVEAPAPPPAAPADSDAHQSWLAGGRLPEAEAHFEAGRFWDAIRAVEEILPQLGGLERVRARVLMARAQARNPKWVKRAETALQNVLSEHPRSIDACLALAELYHASGLPARAAAMLQRVLEIEPQHRTASAGLVALKSPARPGADPGPLFKRLFRKE